MKASLLDLLAVAFDFLLNDLFDDVSDIREHVRLIEKSVVSKEPRFMLRVLRCLATTRQKLNAVVLRRLVLGFYTHSNKERDALLQFIEEVGCLWLMSLKF